MSTQDNPIYRERHFSVAELASLWNLSPKKIRELFLPERDIAVIHNPRRRTRTYKTLRIPESVVKRVYQRLTQGDSHGRS